MVSCSLKQDAVLLQFQMRCCDMPFKVCCSFQLRSSVPPSNRHPCQLQLQLHPCHSAPPPLSFCNSTPVALHLHPCRSATPPLSLCTSTPVALHLHPCRSAPPPLSLCNSTPVALHLHPCRSATLRGAHPLFLGCYMATRPRRASCQHLQSEPQLQQIANG